MGEVIDLFSKKKIGETHPKKEDGEITQFHWDEDGIRKYYVYNDERYYLQENVITVGRCVKVRRGKDGVKETKELKTVGEYIEEMTDRHEIGSSVLSLFLTDKELSLFAEKKAAAINKRKTDNEAVMRSYRIKAPKRTS